MAIMNIRITREYYYDPPFEDFSTAGDLPFSVENCRCRIFVEVLYYSGKLFGLAKNIAEHAVGLARHSEKTARWVVDDMLYSDNNWWNKMPLAVNAIIILRAESWDSLVDRVEKLSQDILDYADRKFCEFLKIRDQMPLTSQINHPISDKSSNNLE